MALTVDQPEGVKSETKIEGADPRDHEAEPAKPTGGNKRKPAATINERMAGTIMENPDAMELSSMGEAPEVREIIGGRNDNMEETRKRTATGEGRTDERPTKEIEGER